MSYQARHNGENISQEEINQKNANNIRNAASVAVATKNPYAVAAGSAVKAADKLTGGKASEDLGKALTKANQAAPGGQNVQDMLDKLNDSGLSDKLGEAAFAYHKYKDHVNKSNDNVKKSSPSNSRPKEPSQDDNNTDDNIIKGKAVIKTLALISAILLLPLFLFLTVAASAATTHTNFEDALGSSYVNEESIGGFVEVSSGTKESQAFYERIASVREELAQEGMIFESVKIVAVYNIINNENNNFTYKKMTTSKIREIAKLMFREEKNEENEIIYIYDEELFKENLREKIYKKQFPFSSNDKRKKMADDTIEYIKDYYSYIGENPNSSGSASTGPYTTWKQYEGSWTNVTLGNSGKTIKEIGCAATSVSILIAKSGVQTTVTPQNPGTFVQKMNQNGGFGSASCLGCINWSQASSVAPSFRFAGKLSVRGYTKEQKLNTLKNLLNQGYYVVAEVKGDTGEHWVAIDTIQGNSIIMIDPGSNSTNLWQTYQWKNTSTYVYYRVV